MIDLAAVQPRYPSPDLVARLDAKELDLWARNPVYRSPDLAAYWARPTVPYAPPSGGGGGSPVTVNVTPGVLTLAGTTASKASVRSALPGSLVTSSGADSLYVARTALPGSVALSGLASLASTTRTATPGIVTLSGTTSTPIVASAPVVVTVAAGVISVTGTHAIPRRLMHTPYVSDYSIRWSAEPVAAVGAIQGLALCRTTAGGLVVATSANRALYGFPVCVAIQSPSGNGAVAVQHNGEIPASVSNVTPGTPGPVRVNASGGLERVASPSSSDAVVGLADSLGNVRLDFTSWVLRFA